MAIMSYMSAPKPGRRMSTLSAAGSSIKEHELDAASLHTVVTNTNETEPQLPGDKSMFFLEMNPFAPVSVVLLHMLFSSHLEWKHVWPKLPEYHLLVPDLPCHSKSRKICSKEDYSVGLCADLVADMIREHAHDGRAHIVGVGTSGYIAMDISRRHPDVVASVFASGTWPQKGVRLALADHPRLVYAGLWSVLHSPGTVLFKLSGYRGEYLHDDLLDAVKRNGSSRLSVAGCAYAREWQDARFLEAGLSDKRVCLIAEGRQGNPEGVRGAARLLRSQSSGGDGRSTRAYCVPDAIHAWNLQFPPLFAKAIQCWIEGLPMPNELEEMPL